MKLFITGASGLLGSNLSFISADKGNDVLAAYNEHTVSIRGCRTTKTDLLNSDFSEIKKFNSDCIIHCAALTNVDLCESNKQLAYAINVETTKKLVDYAKLTNTRFIFISTDSIFDGKKPFHKEDERSYPINYYAQTKIEAEKIVRSLNNHAIIRTNFYGFNIQNKQSFSEWLHEKFLKKEKITAFTDFFFSPIVVNNLAEAIVEIAGSIYSGTLHVAGDGRLSKYEFALKFAEIFKFDKSLVVPTKMNELNSLKAKRPPDCSLDISKAKKLLKAKLLDIDNGLFLYKKLFEEVYQKKLMEE